MRKLKTKAKTRKDIAASYNRAKEFQGRQYTGMAVGRTHHWYYDKADWKEKKITPDKWEFAYSTMKRRAGRAPEGSGVPVGTGYHWFILAHQYVEKQNANDYTTQMAGLKFKLSHKRAAKHNWSASANAQKKNLVQILKSLIAELEREPEQVAPILLDFHYKDKTYKGMGIPILTACKSGACQELDITLNKKHIGIIRCINGEWKAGEIKSKGLAGEIGRQVLAWYQ
jgi:hypothetical protein